MDHTLNELFENKTLKFIFVGGKGGVGKTTTASSIAVKLAQTRGKTLIISTDPAHNLSDAFNQQFSHEPVQVDGVPNLLAMEINPKKILEMTSISLFDGQEFLDSSTSSGGFMEQIFSSFPGIDEAVVFMKLISLSKEMSAEVVVFDTAPTGHTLKLLSFPSTMNKALESAAALKSKLGGILGMFGQSGGDQVDKIFSKLAKLKEDTEMLKGVLSNPDETTFVAVCIPEFLSVYETERLVQELTIQNIDIFNIVVNQIVFFDEGDNCKKCKARFGMQSKYIKQIFQLYSDFHVTLMPLEDNEIRGVPALTAYGNRLTIEKVLPQL
jgi:arsenite-transporting ATPase